MQQLKKALKDGYRTGDLAAYDAKVVVGTSEMGDVIANNINK